MGLFSGNKAWTTLFVGDGTAGAQIEQGQATQQLGRIGRGSVADQTRQADAAIASAGWRRTGGWRLTEQVRQNATYECPVERA